MAFRGQHEHSLDAKDRLTIPSKLRAQLADGAVLVAGLDPCVEIWPHDGFDDFAKHILSGLNPLSSNARMLRRRFHANAQDETARLRRAPAPREAPDRARRPRRVLRRGGRRRSPRGVESRALGRAFGGDGRQGQRRRRGARRRATGPGTTGERGPQPTMATLTYMPTEHVPVLAPELVALTDPQPGELAVDCTFGGGGHARLIAERLGPTGTLVCIDRDPSAAERFAEIQGELGCPATVHSRGLRRRAGRARAARASIADIVYMDLGSPRCSSTRGSAGSRTRTTPRSTCGWTPARRLVRASS